VSKSLFTTSGGNLGNMGVEQAWAHSELEVYPAQLDVVADLHQHWHVVVRIPMFRWI
jgi:hypothetical protein